MHELVTPGYSPVRFAGGGKVPYGIAQTPISKGWQSFITRIYAAVLKKVEHRDGGIIIAEIDSINITQSLL